MSRRVAYPALALVCAVPRLAVLLHEGASITASYTEKSAVFAQVYVESGTFGMIPGEPSASTQPLYGWFLIPFYWLSHGNWLAYGLAQLALAIVTAWLVYEIGRRVVGPRWGVAAAAIATLNPYLVWHDMHINREIVDQVCSAALVLLTLATAARPSRPRALGLGLVTGLAMLGNTRLVFLPILCAAYLLWRLPRSRAAAAAVTLVLAGAAVAVAPWIVRNRVEVGCWGITTDARAMWKANNVHTYGLLTSGHWIDDVTLRETPRPSGHVLHPLPADLSPEEARGQYDKSHQRVVLHPNECRQMSFYEQRTFRFWDEHPGEKAKLMLVSAKLLWQPSVIETSGRPGAGSQLDVGRRLVEPAWMIALYALAVAGVFVARRAFVWLAALLLAYNTACALVFVGATRYRVAWDFLLAVLAAAALRRAAERLPRRRA